MGVLIRETMDLLMIVSAEKIALNESPMDFILTYADLAEEYGEL